MDNENNNAIENGGEAKDLGAAIKEIGAEMEAVNARRHFWELPNGVVMHRFNGADRRVLFVGTSTRDPAKSGNTNAEPHKMYTINIRHIEGGGEFTLEDEDNFFEAAVYEDTKLVYKVVTAHGRRIAYDAAMAGLHRYVHYCEKRTARRKAAKAKADGGIGADGVYHTPQAAIDAIMANPPVADAADAQESE